MDAPFAFSPIDPVMQRDPYPVYARARRECPVLPHHAPPRKVYSVFRYAYVQAILRDSDTWSNEFPPAVAGMTDDMPPPSMLGSDPPRHTRLRSLVNKAFTPRIVQRLEPRMHEIAHELLDHALAAGRVDFVQAFTYPLPVTVIAEIIGVPPEDRAQFKRWSDEAVAALGLGLLQGFDAERLERRKMLFEKMRAYFVPQAEKRLREPQEDLLTGLVQAEHEGSKLSQDEMLTMLVLLLVAGNETTTTLIGNAVLALLDHPEAQQSLRSDPQRLPGAVEEVLRFASPVQFDPRRATRDVEVRGAAIEKDAFALCWLGSANRDESVFERPEVFDVDRARNPHLAFGFGTHYCIGANLARLEARVAIQALLERTRSFAREDDAPLPLHPSPVFNGVTSLPLRLEAA